MLPPVTLYMFEGSSACATGRMMLEHKGIDYKRVDLPPGYHAFIHKAMGIPRISAPALRDGKDRVQGSRRISRWLDEVVPEPRLFPADPDERRRVEDAERQGEELQDRVRRIFWCTVRRNRSLFSGYCRPGTWPAPVTFGVRVTAPFVIWLASTHHRASDDAGRQDVRSLPADLDRVDAWIEEGLLGGAHPNAADFQIATNVRNLLNFEDFAELLRDRPCAAYARRFVPELGVPIPPVIPRPWLETLAPIRP
ncbi:MAG: glutathione S-transferase [Acidobacteriota bacterium]|nr:glutathione S-transferase [Acidobacteriota bacterium]